MLMTKLSRGCQGPVPSSLLPQLCPGRFFGSPSPGSPALVSAWSVQAGWEGLGLSLSTMPPALVPTRDSSHSRPPPATLPSPERHRQPLKIALLFPSGYKANL